MWVGGNGHERASGILLKQKGAGTSGVLKAQEETPLWGTKHWHVLGYIGKNESVRVL